MFFSKSSTTREHGFTLIEMMVVIGIFSALAAVALPEFVTMQRKIGRANAVSQVGSDLRKARAEALSRGVRAIFRRSANGRSYTIGFDYLPFNNPHVMEETTYAAELPANVSIQTARDILFDSRGFVIDDLGEPVAARVTFLVANSPYAAGTVNPMGGLVMDPN